LSAAAEDHVDVDLGDICVDNVELDEDFNSYDVVAGAELD
jgi:hypothetical protein